MTLKPHDQRHSILVAHHEDPLRVALRKTLKEVGYHQIAVADTGRNTLNRLLRDRYHLLIIPLELPDLNCWQLLRMVKSSAFCSPQLPVLVVCDAQQMPLAEPLAHEHQARLLALDDFAQLPNAVAACLNGPQKPTVLIIEDHPGTARLIELNLKTTFAVESALTGEEGLAAWRTQQHDLVLLDLMLPDTNGSEVLRRIIAEKTPPARRHHYRPFGAENPPERDVGRCGGLFIETHRSPPITGLLRAGFALRRLFEPAGVTGPPARA
jgi:CheY-like chemotaxis protein